MARLTYRVADSPAYRADVQSVEISADGCAGEAIERLARFENFYDALIEEQEALLAELDRLRKEDKQKTVKFRESLAQRIMNNNLIARLHGLGLD